MSSKEVMRKDLGHSCPVTDPHGRQCRLLRGHPEDHVFYTALDAVLRRDGSVQTETVNHPAHYGGDVLYEHWKVMVAWGLQRNAFLYNATKYICRSGGAYVGRKNAAAPAEDLRKARWYLDKAIEQAELAEKGFVPEAMLKPTVAAEDAGQAVPWEALPLMLTKDEEGAVARANEAAFLARRERREATCVELGCDTISTPARHSVYCQHHSRPPQNFDGPRS